MARRSSATTALGRVLDDLQARGQYVVVADELARRTGASGVALEAAIRRLKQKRRLAAPRRGFYVLVPIEYRDTGAPPASWFIDALAKFLRQPYYVGLLSAASLHGAAHQQPMTFQVVTDRPTRPARAGRVRISFHQSRSVTSTPTTETQTETGTMRVATPEATAFDLIRFAHASGYASHVATVLAELSERLQPKALAALARHYTVPEVQRLGFVLERVGQSGLAKGLHDWLAGQRVRPVLLAPKERRGKTRPDARWRVIPNARIEVDQ